MSPFLLVTWSLLFSLCWMLPLASPPWSTFPADVWAASPDEARAWLARICKFTDEKECRLAQKTWEKESPNDPRTAAIQWPK